jgi:hypothetical protein
MHPNEILPASPEPDFGTSEVEICVQLPRVRVVFSSIDYNRHGAPDRPEQPTENDRLRPRGKTLYYKFPPIGGSILYYKFPFGILRSRSLAPSFSEEKPDHFCRLLRSD